ncbi:MAG: hypothetical protein ACYCQL_03705 [Acidithiobacillus sp.]
MKSKAKALINPEKRAGMTVDLTIPSYEDPLGRFRNLQGELLFSEPLNYGVSVAINLAELLTSPGLEGATFRYHGREYKKEDFLLDVAMILLSEERTERQKTVLRGLSPERRQRLEALTGVRMPADLYDQDEHTNL